jgi:hypothetical protein
LHQTGFLQAIVFQRATMFWRTRRELSDYGHRRHLALKRARSAGKTSSASLG